MVLLLVVATYVAWSLLDYAGWTGVVIVAVACLTAVAGIAGAEVR